MGTDTLLGGQHMGNILTTMALKKAVVGGRMRIEKRMDEAHTVIYCTERTYNTGMGIGNVEYTNKGTA